MAKLYISEYSSSLTIGGFQVGKEPAITDQTPVTIGAGANNSAAFNKATTLIRVHTDAICSILISTAGTSATANNKRMAANATEYFGVNPSDILSVIQNT